MSKKYRLLKELPFASAGEVNTREGWLSSMPTLPAHDFDYRLSDFFELVQEITKPERIEVDVFPTSGTDCKNGMWVYTYAASNPISQDKFPAIKTAIENVLNPEPKGKNKPIENEFIIGVDPIRGNFEWKDDAQTQVVFKKQEKGEWIAMYRKDNPWSQEHFEADMKKAAEYFSKVSLLCEECGEISKHKETCSQFVKDTLSRDWEIVAVFSDDGSLFYNPDAKVLTLLFDKSGWKRIHSVRRLSDNTVWAVGEMVSTNDGRGEHKIDGFKVIDGQMCVWMKSFPTEYEFLSRIQKLPPKTDSLFVTDKMNDSDVICPPQKLIINGIQYVQSKSTNH